MQTDTHGGRRERQREPPTSKDCRRPPEAGEILGQTPSQPAMSWGRSHVCKVAHVYHKAEAKQRKLCALHAQAVTRGRHHCFRKSPAAGFTQVSTFQTPQHTPSLAQARMNVPLPLYRCDHGPPHAHTDHALSLVYMGTHTLLIYTTTPAPSPPLFTAAA